MNVRPRLLALAVAAGLAAPGFAADYSGVVNFGDSLSDSGSFAPFLPAGTGKFTTNPGPVWTENLGTALGFTVRPANQSGANYAEGGARVTQLPGVPDTFVLTANATPVAQQVTNYLTVSPQANPGALYTVWGGANDLLVQLGLLQAGLINAQQAQANLSTAAGQLGQQVGRLRAAGANTIAVFNLPDVGATPFGRSTGPNAANITGLSLLYNGALDQALTGVAGNLVRIDSFALFSQILASPQAFGFSNSTGTACNIGVLQGNSSLFCTAAALVAPDAASTYMFADSVHPSSALHRVISDFVLALINAPQTASMLAETPVQSRQALTRDLSGRLAHAPGDRPVGSMEVYMTLDYTPVSFDATKNNPGLSIDHSNATAGVDYQAASGVTLGGALSMLQGEADFDSQGGGFKQKEMAYSIYAGYRQDALWLTAIVSGGDIRYRDVRRNIRLNTGTLTATATPDGYNRSWALEGGYGFKTGGLTHGPFARLIAQRVRVDAYGETGAGAANLQFGAQVRRSLVGSLGYELAYHAGAITPYVRLALEHEFKDEDRVVSAAPVGSTGAFSMPAFKPDDNYGSAAVGLSARLGTRINAGAEASTVFSQSDVTTWGMGGWIALAF